MILTGLLVIVLIFTFFNYSISKSDFFNPGVIFCLVHLAGVLMCVFFSDEYGIEYNIDIMLVFGLGLFSFTLANFLAQLYFNKINGKLTPVPMQPMYIKVNGNFMRLVIGFQLVVLVLTLLYVIHVARAYYGAGSISESIGKYRMFMSRHSEELASLDVHRSFIVRIGKLACTSLTYPILAIMLNNLLVRKKIDKLLAISVSLQILYSFLTGTRSGAFRIVTGAIFFWIVIHRKLQGAIHKGNFKLILRLCVLAVFLGIGFVTVRDLIGRIYNASDRWYHPIIPYLGGPIMNLNNSLEVPMEKSSLFGQYTFVTLYNQMANWLGIETYSTHDINIFNYHNGLPTGNVDTMYHAYICDFGFWGVFPLTFICGIVYCFLYNTTFNLHNSSSPLNVRFFMYGYMLNSLIMSCFSNRFYENMVSIFTLELIVGFWILWLFMQKYILIHEPYAAS